MMLKKLYLFLFVSVILFGSITTEVYGSQTDSFVALSDDIIEPYINTTKSVSLNTSTYKNVVSDNNLVTATVYVTNHADNIGPIYVRIINSSGLIIGDQKYVSPGNRVSFVVYWDAGTYTVQAKAVSISGTYKIHVHDQ